MVAELVFNGLETLPRVKLKTGAFASAIGTRANAFGISRIMMGTIGIVENTVTDIGDKVKDDH